MSVISNEIKQPASGDVSSYELEQVDRALIDLSARTPVLYLYASAIFWLLVQTLLGTICSIKVHSPEFLSECPWVTYGRVVPAQSNAMMYGWASLAGLGTAVWLLARMCKVTIPRPGLLLIGTTLWNLAVAAGLIGILAGFGRGFAYLEMPQGAMDILFVAYCVIGVWGAMLFIKRRPGHIYISTAYLVAALFWFPWLLGIANVLLHENGVTGVMRAVVAAWYAQNVIGLWLGAIGLGAIYYLIPKVLGRPVHSYYLAAIGFWTFAVFSVWTGMQRLAGGPVPAWIVTVSIVAAILMLIPVATVTVNYLFTMRSGFSMVYHSPTIRFVFFGAIAYTLANLVFLVGSFRSVSGITQLSWFNLGQDQLFIYAFFSMVMFGAMYYIIPRLVGCEWLSASFIRIHFWGTAYGFAMSILMLLYTGWMQGGAQSVIQIPDATTASTDFMISVFALTPGAVGRIMAQFLISIGVLTFALHFLLMLLRLGRPSGQPTLFAPIHKGAH